jgi:hypothetical protein
MQAAMPEIDLRPLEGIFSRPKGRFLPPPPGELPEGNNAAAEFICLSEGVCLLAIAAPDVIIS